MDKKYGGYTAAVLREFIEHSKNNGESIDAITNATRMALPRALARRMGVGCLVHGDGQHA